MSVLVVSCVVFDEFSFGANGDEVLVVVVVASTKVEDVLVVLFVELLLGFFLLFSCLFFKASATVNDVGLNGDVGCVVLS